MWTNNLGFTSEKSLMITCYAVISLITVILNLVAASPYMALIIVSCIACTITFAMLLEYSNQGILDIFVLILMGGAQAFFGWFVAPEALITVAYPLTFIAGLPMLAVAHLAIIFT